MMSYDKENIFAKILDGSIACSKILESDYTVSFYDINPQAPKHALIIPKGAYSNITDFSENASSEEMVDWVQAIGKVAKKIGVDEEGYRVLINTGKNASQEVPHLHAHIVGGGSLGKCFSS